jgi:transposase
MRQEPIFAGVHTMPWRESSVMEERLGFVARLLDGEGMSDVCREFGISRKTGYKLFNRYKDHGLDALTDRSRRPVRYANQLPDQIERAIVAAKKNKPHWGARKIRELLVRRLAGDVRLPSKSTVHAVLDRHGLVQRARQRRRCKAEGTPLSLAAIRKRIEEAFGWLKTVAGQDKTRFRGRDRVGWAFTFTAAAYNLVRACRSC